MVSPGKRTLQYGIEISVNTVKSTSRYVVRGIGLSRTWRNIVQAFTTHCKVLTHEIIVRDVTDSESASESDGIRHFFLKSEIRLILKIRLQWIYGFRNCCFSPIYLLFIQLFS